MPSFRTFQEFYFDDKKIDFSERTSRILRTSTSMALCDQKSEMSEGSHFDALANNINCIHIRLNFWYGYRCVEVKLAKARSQ